MLREGACHASNSHELGSLLSASPQGEGATYLELSPCSIEMFKFLLLSHLGGPGPFLRGPGIPRGIKPINEAWVQARSGVLVAASSAWPAAAGCVYPPFAAFAACASVRVAVSQRRWPCVGSVAGVHCPAASGVSGAPESASPPCSPVVSGISDRASGSPCLARRGAQWEPSRSDEPVCVGKRWPPDAHSLRPRLQAWHCALLPPAKCDLQRLVVRCGLRERAKRGCCERSVHVASELRRARCAFRAKQLPHEDSAAL